MRIAFDLDDTLIPCRYGFPTESPCRNFIARFIAYEPLRKGTQEVFAFYKERGWQIWIYTTSYRSPFYIKCLFWL